MALAGYLFSDRPVSDHLKQRRQSLAAQVNALSSLDTLAADAEDCGRRAQVTPCVIHRKVAKPVADNGPTAVKVTLTIPVEGDTDLLKMRVPTDEGENVLVKAQYRNGDVWPGEERTQNRIEITESFDAGTSTEDVRAKLKQSVDAIEANLSLINAIVEKHNASIPAEVDRLLTQRRQVLETTSSLRDELGEGI